MRRRPQIFPDALPAVGLMVILPLLALSAPVSSVPVTDGLVLHLSLSEALVEREKVVAIGDLSGRGNHAGWGVAPDYAPSATPSGRGAMSFDGSSQYLEIPGSPDFDGRARTTLVIFRARELGVGRMVNSAYATLNPEDPAAQAHYSVGSIFANASGGGVLRIQNRTATGAAVAVSTPGETVAPGAFYLGVNLWRDNGEVTALVVNGAGERAAGSSTGATANPQGHLWTRLGANAGTTDPAPRDFFQGEIAAILVFGRALSQEELAAMEAYLVDKYLRPVVPIYYREWIEKYGLAGDDVDPLAGAAGDGVANLTKFAFGLNPLKPSAGAVPSVFALGFEGNRHLWMRHRRNPAAQGIGQVFEISADLVDWSSDPGRIEILTDDTGLFLARDNVPLGADDRRFVRLRNFLLHSDEASTARELWTNSLGMEMIRLPPGQFRRGSDGGSYAGDYDERPSHEVILTGAFSMSSTPVTNAQYEVFSPGHRARRGELGLSSDDDEAVIFVTWHEAVAFTEWLSAREGKTYRLPTEAEWEYAARAGTTTAYFTGPTLPEVHHRNQHDRNWQPVSLHVGQTPPNPWGFHDIHGLVEEWCLDWYGPYVEGKHVNPVGYRDGEFRVTRGGSHNTHLRYLRSASRAGEVPENEHHVIGFRVVQAEAPDGAPLEGAGEMIWAEGVSQEPFDWSAGPAEENPFFAGPIPFVNIPPGASGPVYSHHNHHPAITGLPNGDLLATWYTTHSEWSRETKKVAARLRAGSTAWDEASVFFDPPGRNAHASALWWDGEDTIYAFFGHTAVAEGHFIPTMRKSTDNGRTWTRARIMKPRPTAAEEYSGLVRLQRTRPAWQAFGLRDGALAVVTKFPDNIAYSYDDGETWTYASRGRPGPASGDLVEGGSGYHIPAIHPVIQELNDGRLLAFTSRVAHLDGQMIQSVSSNRGENWTYSASPFRSLGPGNGQRVMLLRLREGPLFLASFTDHTRNVPEEQWEGMLFQDQEGGEFRGYGLFGALSFDEGETWPVRKLITPGPGSFDGGAWTGEFTTSFTHAEPRGYLNATQTPDGIVHLISSRLHYRFNLAWLTEPNQAPSGEGEY